MNIWREKKARRIHGATDLPVGSAALVYSPRPFRTDFACED